MTVLFDRKVEVVAGTDGYNEARLFSEHRIDFQLDHQHGQTASSGTVSIWNLSRTQRAWMRDHAEVAVLRAGYAARLVDAFTGEIDRVEFDFRTPDNVTKLVLGDGIAFSPTQRIAVTLPSGLSLRLGIEHVARAIGLPIAYLESVPALSDSFLQSRSFNGLASDALEALSQQAGLEWTVTDGQLYLVSSLQVRRDRAFLVNSETGLVGTPELVTKRKNNRERVTGVRFRTLLLPELRPNHVVQLESREFRGPYKAERVTHEGGNGWDSSYYSTVEAKAL